MGAPVKTVGVKWGEYHQPVFNLWRNEMSNNSLILSDVTSGEKVCIAKYYPSDGWYPVQDLDEKLRDFFERSAMSTGTYKGNEHVIELTYWEPFVDVNQIPDDYISWAGGECPVKDEEGVQVKVRNNELIPPWHRDKILTAGLIDWTHNGTEGDIVAYRVATPANYGETK
jgi:hypothetical protein